MSCASFVHLHVMSLRLVIDVCRLCCISLYVIVCVCAEYDEPVADNSDYAVDYRQNSQSSYADPVNRRMTPSTGATTGMVRATSGTRTRETRRDSGDSTRSKSTKDSKSKRDRQTDQRNKAIAQKIEKEKQARKQKEEEAAALTEMKLRGNLELMTWKFQ